MCKIEKRVWLKKMQNIDSSAEALCAPGPPPAHFGDHWIEAGWSFDNRRIDILITTSTSKCSTPGKSVCIHNEPPHYNWTGVVANPGEMTLSRSGTVVVVGGGGWGADEEYV